MTAVVALVVFFCLLTSGCKRTLAPAPASTPSAIGAPSATSTASASPTPTPVPYAKRRFPCVSSTIVGDDFDYSPGEKESLHAISAKLGVDSRLLGKANHMSRFAEVEPGKSVHIDNRHIAPCDIDNGILINVPQRMLFFYREGKLEAFYPVAVGKPDWETPTGVFQVIKLARHPVWMVPDDIQEEMELAGEVVRKRVPPGPGNPLGDYWIGLSMPGIGIHGTNAPVSVYSYRTHGCIRLQPANSKDLFHRVSKDTHGMIVYEPVLFAKLPDGRVFLEVDRDIYEEGTGDLDNVKRIADSTALTNVIDWSRAGEVVEGHDGIAHDVSAKP